MTRKEVRAWIGERLEGETEVSLREVSAAARIWLSRNPAVLSRFVEDSLADLVGEESRRVAARSRRILAGDTLIDNERFAEKARSQPVFARWLERVGERHIRLDHMTREDLLEAAAYRDRSGLRDLAIANWWRTLAGGLEGGQTVGDRYSAEEVERFREEAFQQWNQEEGAA